MKLPFLNSLYNKTILLVIFAALAPGIIGTMIFLLGARELLELDTAQRMQVLAAQFNELAGQAIENLAAQSEQLYSLPETRESLAQLNAMLTRPDKISDLQTNARRIAGSLGETLRNQIQEQRLLECAQSAVFHHKYDEPVILIDYKNTKDLERIYHLIRSEVSFDLKWQICDTHDPLDINRRHVLFLYAVDGDTLNEADFIHVSLIDVNLLFPFIRSNIKPDNIGLSLRSNRGYTLLQSVDFNDSLLDISPNQIFGLDSMEGVRQLDIRFYGPQALLVWRKISALRLRRGEHSLHSDWMIFMVGNMTESQALFVWLYWRVAIAIAVITLVLCGLSVLLIRRIVRPIAKLTQSAEEMTAGRTHFIETKAGLDDEVGRLTQSFNAMVKRLENSYSELSESYMRSREQADQLELLQDITNAINTKLHLDETLMTTIRELHRLVRFDVAAISIYDENSGELNIKATYPGSDATIEQAANIALLTGNNSRWVIEARKPLKHTENISETSESDNAAKENRIQSFVILPLISSGGVIGAFGIGRHSPQPYTETQSDMLMRLCDSLAAAIEHSRLYDRTSAFAEKLEHKIEQRSHELKAAQDKLIETEKLAATGRLAGTLAHEINNPLGIIKNYLKIVVNQVYQAGGGRRASDPNMEHLLIMQEELDRIARIVRNLMDFYKPSPGFRQPVNLQKTMDNILRLLETDWNKRNLDVEKHYVDNLPCIFCSQDLVRQVFMNLLRNAEDAMEVNGKLTIEVQLLPDDKSSDDRQTIQIRISDTGCGIPSEVIPQIFDPFFTTKKEGQGTGLGLSVTYSIMRSLEGTIDVQSRIGKGTTILLHFPVIESDETYTPPSTEGIVLG